ncbi:metallophosphoesterase [Agrobacterium vitis]|uniref:metallophosphoesterase n=1 Tax=Agrobacterium vitis TaxID=373 RepID=UPI003D274E6F
MKAWVISDLHAMSSGTLPLTIPDADVCVCAGDVSGFIQVTMECLERQIAPFMPIILVLGNHDYYHSSVDGALEYARRVTRDSTITVLENESVVIGSVRFLGATLWTDYLIPFGGSQPELPLPERRDVAIHFGQKYLMDFRAIYGSNSYAGDGLISPQEIIGRHEASRSFITNQLATPFDGRTVVVTHHAPSPRSKDIRFLGQPTNAGFLSDLDELIEDGKPNFWIHGHIHRRFDYRIGRTRVLCNPRGYWHEKTGYQPGLVIDLDGE